MPVDPLERLPKSLLNRATLSGKEYAWRISDIPEVIEAARNANLVSFGGQLQFLIPDKFGGGTCECYWVNVDTPDFLELSWSDRVTATAQAALSSFEKLKLELDFMKEGMNAFGKYLKAAEAQGGNIEEMMWFVWYAVDAEENARIRERIRKGSE